MDLGIAISYIIAGFLIIIIATVGYNVNYSGNELTLQESQKKLVSEVIATLSYDIPKIGYNLNGSPDTLLKTAAIDKIEFYANIDNSGDETLELVTWEFSKTPVSETENPNDYSLVRTVGGITTVITAGITNFSINYYDEMGSTVPLSLPISATSNKSMIDTIVQIEINLETESTVGLKYIGKTDTRYLASSWTKRFSPSNLMLN